MTLAVIGRFVVPGGIAVSLFALTGFLMFAMGGAAGASAAVNESVHIADVKHNISTVDTEVRQQIESNLTETEELAYYGFGGWMLTPLIDMTIVGVEFGYAHPGEAQLLAQAAIPITAVWMAWIIYRPLKAVVGLVSR